MKDTIEKYTLDAQALREILEYSSKFYDNRFYVVIDAESFEGFEECECFQLAYDLMLISIFCQVKLIVVVGCFRSRDKTHRKKRLDFLQKILSCAENLKKYFNQITMVGIGEAGNSLRLDHFLFEPSESISAAEETPIVISPAVKIEDGNPVDVIDVDQFISRLTKADERKLFSKVVIVSASDGIFDSQRNLLHQMLSSQAREMLKKEIATGQTADIVRIAVYCIEQLQIGRVHVVNGKKSGALLVELYTKEGSGTMIYRGGYESVRPAKESDAAGIYGLILHYARRGIILLQSFEDIRVHFSDFIVGTIDDHVVACARLRCFAEEHKAFVSSVAVSPHYMRQGIGKKLLAEMERRAKCAGMKMLTLVGLDWWLYQGFLEGKLSDLPEEIRREYARRETPKKVLFKNLS